jgi:hypothetical protein
MIKSASAVAMSLLDEAEKVQSPYWINKSIIDQIQLIDRHLTAMKQHLKGEGGT